MASHDDAFNSPACAAPTYWYSGEWETEGPKTGWYFFYGTLKDPSILKEVIGSEEQPVLRPAKIFGFRMMMWGGYPALVRDKDNAVVQGAAFKVENATQAQRLEGYEPDAYAAMSCRVHFDDGEELDAAGWTFVWDTSLNELSEGQFGRQGSQSETET